MEKENKCVKCREKMNNEFNELWDLREKKLKNKPNGIQYFALGFSIAALISDLVHFIN